MANENGTLGDLMGGTSEAAATPDAPQTLGDLMKQSGEPTQAFQLGQSDESQSGDTWKAVKAGVQSGVVGPALAGGRYLSEKAGSEDLTTVFKNLGIASDEFGKQDVSEMSPAAQKALEASVTSPDFWSHPLMAAKLKAANMTPMLAATLVPSMLVSGPVGTTLMVGVANGTIGAGAASKEIYDKIDGMSDQELQAQVPFYKDLRAQGTSEQDAREAYDQKVQGNVPLINLLMGAAAGVAGPAAGLARVAKGGAGIVGAAERGIVGRTALGAAEGAGVNAAQGGTQDATVQQALVDNQLQGKFDTASFGRNLVDQLAMGAPLGAVGGMVSHGGKTAEVPDKVTPKVEVVGPAAPNAAESVAMEANSTPAPVVPQAPDVAPHEITPTDQPAPAAPPRVAAASQRLDTGQNVPESPETLAIQQKQLVEGKRPAQMFPAGTDELPLPAGAGRHENDRGVFHYNPGALTPDMIDQLSAAGRENEILGLGPHSKPEIEARVAAGETPVGVTEHTLDGVEVRSAAGTDQTAPAQAAHFEATKDHPDNVVTVGPPPERVQRASRVLDAQTPEADKVRAEQVAAQDAAQPQLTEAAPEADPSVSTDKNVTRQKKRAADAAVSKAIFDAQAPKEATFPTTAAAREELRQRLTQTMLDAEKAGIDVKAIKAYPTTPDHMVWLREAYDLKKTLDKKGMAPKRRDEHISTFLGREAAAVGGDFKIMRSERAAEGEMLKRRAQKDVSEVAATAEPAKNAEDTAVADAGSLQPEVKGELAAHEDDSAPTPVRSEATLAVGSPEEQLIAKQDGAEIGGLEADRPPAPIEAREKPVYESKAEEIRAKSAALKARREAGEKLPAKVTVPKKIATIKQRIAAAAKETEAKPTDAQKEAGNYQKGHVSIHGLDVAIENPRGSERSGVGPDGKPWSVKLPDHYGYIKRTEGADGDHVDAYIGPHPDSPHVFVIDQHDLATKKFDEHKVMLGYKDAVDAMSAYEKAFSDGKGFERLGLIKPMSVDGFKDWLKNGDTTKAAAEIPAMAHRAASDSVRFESVATGVKADLKPLYSTTVKEVLSSIRFDHLDGVSKKLIPYLTGQIAKLVEKTPVHILSSEEMGKLDGQARDAKGKKMAPAMGMYVPDNARGRRGDYILLNADDLKTTGDFVHTMVHETVHAVMVREVATNTEVEMTIRSLMSDVQSHYGDALPSFAKYAFTDAHEFLAEAFANPDFQQLLAETPISAYNAERIGLSAKIKPTMWDYFMASIRKVLRGLGVPEGSFSALEGALRIGKDVLHDARRSQFDPLDPANVVPQARRAPDMGEVKRGAEDVRTNAAGKVRAGLDKLSSTIMLGERAEHGPLPGAAHLVELKAMMERDKSNILEKEGGAQISRDIAAYEREHGQAEFEKLATLGFDASRSDVNLGAGASNDHLGKDATHGWQAKARLADFQKRFDALPHDGQELLTRTGEFFKKVQNDISLQLIKNTLDKIGVNEPGLAERIHRDGLTTADREKFKTNGIVKHLAEAREVKELKGLYIPFRRYGDYVVNAYHKLIAPKNGLKISGDTIQFTDANGSDTAARRMAQAFVENHDLDHVGTEKVWVDKTDPSKKIAAEDVNAVPAYRVKMMTQHTEMLESEATAKRLQEHFANNKDALGFERVDDVRKRADFVAKGGNALSGHMQTVMAALEKQDRFKGMSAEEQAAVRQTINEAAVRVLGSTRLQQSFQQRRGVLGYSEQLGRVTADYAKAATGYLAKLRIQPKIDAAFEALQKYTDQHKYDGQSLRRDELMGELRKRIYAEPEDNSRTMFGKVTRRILQISSLDKLAGVSFHVVNAQEPWTTSLPVIGGRHGFIAAARTLGHAYDLIGARSGVMAGFKDTGKAFTKDSGFTDYLKTFKSAIDNSPAVGGAKAKRLGEVLDYGDARGIFNDDAVHEVGRYADPAGNVAARALDRADLMARQMGNAIEKINRTVTMLSAYELEFKKNGGNHEAAMHYAYEVTHDTMGDYSSWNSSPLFKSNTGMLALQFKKFAHKTYYLLGKTLKGTLQGDPEMAKQFAGLMVTHALVAGALGLPLEPFKVALLAANVAGITGFTYQDFELAVREKAAEVLGTKGSEVFSHGLTRLLGIETSNRQGLDSLMTWSVPNDPTRQTDLKAWLFDTVGGASASLMLDYMKASQALMKGDVTKALELTIPIKAASDVIKAGEGLSPTTDKRGHVTFPGFSAGEAAAQAIGFSSASKAENFEHRAQAARLFKDQSTARADLVSAWVSAKPADKAAAYQAALVWSKSQPVAVRIKPSDLIAAATKAKAQAMNSGIRQTKQNAAILNRLTPVYGK